MKVVVDTNVVVSGVLRPASKPGQILDLCLDGQLHSVVSVELIAEYREVLLRPKFGFDAGLVEALVDGLEAFSQMVVPVPQHAIASGDPKNQFLIDLASTADAYITTGNVRHFTQYPRTLSPAEFLLLLGSGREDASSHA